VCCNVDVDEMRKCEQLDNDLVTSWPMSQRKEAAPALSLLCMGFEVL
jgi:hypothetical protein